MNQKFRNFGDAVERFLSGKGFYIVLFLCIAAIAASAWVLTHSGNIGNFAEPEIANPANGVLDDDYDNVFGGNQPPIYIEDEEETNSFQEVISTGQNPAEEDEIHPVIAVPAPPIVTTFMWPITGEIEMPYSVGALVYDQTMGDWRTHRGVDIAASAGAKVLACSSGVIDSVFQDQLMGTTVVISHGDGLLSLYSNLADVPTVMAGDKVSTGDVVGSVGETAIAEISSFSHLHFEMLKNGVQTDPTNYLQSLNG